MALPQDPDALFNALRQGDRSALARAITLAESTRPAEQGLTRALVKRSLPYAQEAARIGITGIPGVGKSTLIDALGIRLIDAGHRVAVLAIDPSSPRSGGSILGDKTRMEKLSVHPAAYIRPSAAGGTLGGVARRTREAIVLCAAAGYDRVLVETVGVGQNELAVDRMTDINLLLMIAGAGDELQGIKRGIMEAADLIAITKVEGANAERSARTASELRNAIQLLPARSNGERPAVLRTSAISGVGIPELVEKLEGIITRDRDNGSTQARRAGQDRWWMRSTIEEALLGAFDNDPQVRAALPEVTALLDSGELDPFEAAQLLLAQHGRPQ